MFIKKFTYFSAKKGILYVHILVYNGTYIMALKYDKLKLFGAVVVEKRLV